MTIESHVTNLELSKQLKNLGIPQNSFIKWWISDRSGYAFLVPPNQFVDATDTYTNKYSAFLASELCEILPCFNNGSILEILKGISFGDSEPTYCARYYTAGLIALADENIANACANMIIHLIENDLLKVEELK